MLFQWLYHEDVLLKQSCCMIMHLPQGFLEERKVERDFLSRGMYSASYVGMPMCQDISI